LLYPDRSESRRITFEFIKLSVLYAFSSLLHKLSALFE